MSFSDFLELIWRRRWVVLLVTGLTAVLGVVFAANKQAEYVSTATVVLTPKPDAGFVPSDNLAALLNTFATTAESSVNESEAESILGRPLPGDIETSTESGTGVLRISGRATDPDDARDTAAATTEAFLDGFEDNELLTAETIDPATTPTSPAQPRPPLIIGTSVLVGFGFGLLFALGIDAMRRRVETGEELLELTGVPTLGRLRNSKMLSRSGARLVWTSGSELALQEQFRLLRTNLRFLMADNVNTIQVTSAIPKQGKSTVIANLGVAFAQVGIPTTIVDADMRRPSQHTIFGVENTSGLSIALANPSIAPELRDTGIAGLSLLTSGPNPENPSELLSTRFGGILQTLRQAGGLVLIDSPPVLAVSDARLVAGHADGVLLVVAKGTNKPAAVEASLEKLEWAGARTLGFILNRSEEDVGDARSYYTGGGINHQAADLMDGPQRPAVPSASGLTAPAPGTGEEKPVPVGTRPKARPSASPRSASASKPAAAGEMNVESDSGKAAGSDGESSAP